MHLKSKERGKMIKQAHQKKILSPKLDIVFQALFGEEGSERITKDFLQTILKEEITEIQLDVNPILRRDTPNDKLGILDVVAKINGKENCDIEMQIVDNENLIDRILYYWGKRYTKTLNKGEDYKKLEKTIVILITDKKMKNLEELKYHTEWKILELEKRQKILTDKFEIHIIELEKIKERKKRTRQTNRMVKLYNKSRIRKGEKKYGRKWGDKRSKGEVK